MGRRALVLAAAAALAALAAGCATEPAAGDGAPTPPAAARPAGDRGLWRAAVDEAERAGGSQARLFRAADAMLAKGSVVRGSCWDYVSALFRRAGFAERNIESVYAKPLKGPWADTALIQAGDWLLFRNLSYGRVEHSAVFVCWTDYDRSIGLTLSYVGQNRSQPGRLFRYDLSQVYGIRRAK